MGSFNLFIFFCLLKLIMLTQTNAPCSKRMGFVQYELHICSHICAAERTGSSIDAGQQWHSQGSLNRPPNCHCVHWWSGFPMRKHEKWRSIISPSKQSCCQVTGQTIYFSVCLWTVCDCVWLCVRVLPHVALLVAAWILLHPLLWVCEVLVCHKWHKRHFEWPECLDWDTSVEIRFGSGHNRLIWQSEHFRQPCLL